MEVNLMQILEAREVRVARQARLAERYRRPVVCFSMNIPGPVKDSPLLRRGFYAGCAALDAALPGEKVLHRDVFEADTGCEALLAVDMEPLMLKRITTHLEDHHDLGRLFDMDVIDTNGKKLEREAVGGGSRDCIVCGAPGRGCASRRVHGVPELQCAVSRILTGYFSRRIGNLAVQSLLDEVETTPKPGLVDLRNSGSHRDMDASTFRASAAALGGYFRECAQMGMEHSQEPPQAVFQRLRSAGLLAEKAMYEATGGVNTHKGAIFTMGILCGAAGRIWKSCPQWEEADLFREVAAMTRDAMDQDFRTGGDTVGHRLYARFGIRGIRGQVSDGLPAVEHIGLPAFRMCISRGEGGNAAGVHTLLTLIAGVEDTNMIARGGLDGAAEGAMMAQRLLEQGYSLPDVEALDAWFIQRNLSPGGCADLLAAVYFVNGLNGI